MERVISESVTPYVTVALRSSAKARVTAPSDLPFTQLIMTTMSSRDSQYGTAAVAVATAHCSCSKNDLDHISLPFLHGVLAHLAPTVAVC